MSPSEPRHTKPTVVSRIRSGGQRDRRGEVGRGRDDQHGHVSQNLLQSAGGAPRQTAFQKKGMENLEAELNSPSYASLQDGRRRSGPGKLAIVLAAIFTLSLVAFTLALTGGGGPWASTAG